MTHRENTISTRVYFFMFHLSIADEMTAFFTLLPEIVWSLTKEFHGGNIVCKSVKFLQMLGPYLRYENVFVNVIDGKTSVIFEDLKRFLKTYLAKKF